MSEVLIDSSLFGEFQWAQEPLQVRGIHGQLLGHFIPITSQPLKGPQVSDEELQRREKTGGGRPLAKILADLEAKG